MYHCRAAVSEDYPAISTLPQSAEELFYSFPSARYPLTPEQIESTVKTRLLPTVLLYHDKVIGFANVYRYEEGKHCWLGNVVVSSEHRGSGAATTLIQEVIELARTELKVPKISLIVHNTNLAALLFYAKLGLQPVAIGKMKNHKDETVAKITMSLDLTAGTD